MERHARLHAFAREIGVALDRDQLELLLAYEAELLAWNRKVNLTSITGPDEVLVKHFIDSLACLRAFPQFCSSLADIGSGAGFPGLPLAIAARDLLVTLIEPNQKKVSFLLHVIGTLGLQNVRVEAQTIEELARARDPATSVSCAVTRALDVTRLFGPVRSILTEAARFVLCRSSPYSSTSSSVNGFEIEKEIVYELPAHFGQRVLTVLKPVDECST